MGDMTKEKNENWWWWEFVDEYNKSMSHVYGLYHACEEILMGIFPLDFDERDSDGKWKAVIFLNEGGMGRRVTIYGLR